MTAYDYRPSWNKVIGINDPIPNTQSGVTSLAHPWGAGPVKWLSEEVLGIKPTTPGFKTYDVLPHLGRTLTSVQGKTPIPNGEISASFNTSTGLCKVIAPPGTVGRIGIPKVEKSITSITINGSSAWDGAYHAVAGVGGASQDSDFVYFTGVQPGTYSFATAYTGTTPAYDEPAETYPARFIKLDSSTSGNWGNVYGKEGYVLCNYNGSGNDKKSLPSYISSVTYFRAFGGTTESPDPASWASPTNDTRALAPDSTNGTGRSARALINNQPTFTFTVHATGTREYQVALYFVDWNNKSRRQAVEMLDAVSLKLIAPVKVVDGYSGGKYLVFAYNKSATFRIDHILGDSISVSGIFFDPAPPVGARKGLGWVDPLAPALSISARKATASFRVTEPFTQVEATVFDLNGRIVARLLKKNYSEGYHRVDLSMPHLTTGDYTLQLKVGKSTIVNKNFSTAGLD